MSDAKDPFGFGKYVPGFDFLQNLAKGAPASPQMPGMPPGLANWVAPTLNVDELDRRIEELKAVQFWLEQNATALKATLQALEVQKMTLATLQGMNFQMNDVADAFQARTSTDFTKRAEEYSRTAGEFFASYQKAAAQQADDAQDADDGDDADDDVSPPDKPLNFADSFKSAAQPKAKAARKKAAAPKPAQAAGPAAGVVDPMQWWGALTQQFQQIASNAMNDVAQNAAAHSAATAAAGGKAAASKAAKPAARRSSAKGAAKSAPAKAGKSTPARGGKASSAKAASPRNGKARA